jgi:hypothetical protein
MTCLILVDDREFRSWEDYFEYCKSKRETTQDLEGDKWKSSPTLRAIMTNNVKEECMKYKYGDTVKVVEPTSFFWGLSGKLIEGSYDIGHREIYKILNHEGISFNAYAEDLEKL